MKKNLFLIACIAPFLGFAQATVFVGSNAKVTNKANTLITVKGDMKVANVPTTDGVNVNNHGNINVTGGFVNNDSDGTNFVNRFTSGTSYGQLILDNSANINAKISGQFKLVNNFAYHSFAVPYKTTVGDLLKDAGVDNPHFEQVSPGNYNENRGKNPLFKWDNATSILEHYKNIGEVVRPFEYIAFGNVTGYTPTQNMPQINTVRTYTGELVLHKTSPAENGASAYATLWNTTVQNTAANQYGELWGTYVDDPFTSTVSVTPAAWADLTNTVDNVNGYGKNLASLGNPYTSNIDLRKANMPGAIGVYQYVGNTYVREDGNSDAVASATNFVMATFTDNTNVVGDATAMIVRPYHTFAVKSNNSNNSSWSFPNTVKTFETPGITALSFKGNQGNDFYQVGIDLYDAQGVNTNARFYVVASNEFQADSHSKLEANNIFLEDNAIGAYTLQESIDGSINEDLKTNKTYINGINATDYIAKPVHVVFQGSTGGEYTFKARLSESLLNSGNKFYFEDKVGGVIKEITPDFVYNFSQAGTVADRFVIYYNGLPSDLNVAEVAGVAAETIVYQDINKTHNIRFAKGLNSADIFVYALSGQLVFTDKNVKTDVDYVLPKQAQAGAFVVKIVGDNGNVTTKKIVQ